MSSFPARLGYCFTPYQRPLLYSGAPFSRLLRHAGDTEEVFSAYNPGVTTGVKVSYKVWHFVKVDQREHILSKTNFEIVKK